MEANPKIQRPQLKAKNKVPLQRTPLVPRRQEQTFLRQLSTALANQPPGPISVGQDPSRQHLLLGLHNSLDQILQQPPSLLPPGAYHQIENVWRQYLAAPGPLSAQIQALSTGQLQQLLNLHQTMTRGGYSLSIFTSDTKETDLDGDQTHTVSLLKTTQALTTSKSIKKDLHVFVYDAGDRVLSPIWKASADAFAKSVDGITVQSGANAAATLDNIVQAFDKNRVKYACIRSIEFFGHGTAGATLVGKGSLKENDIPAAATKATTLTGSHSGPTVLLHKNFARLRGALCSPSYIHFRTCETFKGTQGAKFASSLAAYLGKSYLIGHTKIIDINLPGREIYDPTGKKMKPNAKIPDGLWPAKQPASELRVQSFRIEIDLSELGKGKTKKLPWMASFLLAGRNTIHLSAQIRDHPDAEKYLLRAIILAPVQVTLGSLAKLIPMLVPSGTVTGPTVGLIKPQSNALDIPIDRHLVERIAHLPVLTLPYTTPYGRVKIKITGTSKGPGAITRAGGFELRVGALYSSAFTKSVLGIANIQLPLAGFDPSVKSIPINIFRIHTGADVLFGNKTTVGLLNLGIRVDFETMRADLGVFVGGGLYEGQHDWMMGGEAGIGIKLGNFTVDAGWHMFFTGKDGKEPNYSGLLRLGWRFE